MTPTCTYEGEAYRAPSGSWSWRIREHGTEIAGGAGYASELDAWQAMFDELSGLTDLSRAEVLHG